MDQLFTFRKTLKLLQVPRVILDRCVESGLVKPVKFGGRILFTDSQLKILSARLRRSR